jgi:hypothetical protein
LTVGAPGPDAMKKVIAFHREYLAQEQEWFTDQEQMNLVQ